jgi:trimeric autotransporter adhesin
MKSTKTVLKLATLLILVLISFSSTFSQSWSPIGNGTNWEYSLVVYNNELYAGEQSGNSGSGLKKFNGTTWSDFGGINGTVHALAVYNGKLFVGGSFTLAGGLEMKNIAQWDGVEWADVSGGPNSIVSAFTVYNGDLIVGGYFTMVENMNANHIAKWNSNGGWVALGSGTNSQVMALTTYNNKLIAGGFFTTAGGGSASHIAQWDGSNWSPIGSGINNIVYGMTSGNGKLYAGGLFSQAGGIPAQGIASWDGSQWSNLGSGCSGGFYPYVFSILVQGTDVYAAGLYTIAGGQTVNGIAKWNGSTWSGLGSGFWSGGSNVFGAYASCIYNGKLVCGGIFSSAGGISAGNVAQWDLLLTGVNNNNEISDKFELSQNYPNPFNPSTKINFNIPKSGNVKLNVFDASGKEVAELVNENLNAGIHEVTFNASALSSGVYFYTLKSNDFVETKKMTLVK